jgi:leukotriene-A4 hydrolase
LKDATSFSNFRDVRVTNFHLALTADFETSVLSGYVDLNIEALKDNVKELVLDTRDLKIRKVQVAGRGIDLEYKIGESSEAFGASMTIQLPEDFEKKLVVRVSYSTSPQASAIQWLPKEQTAGKEHPYLFTQCQAIHCRSMIPIQDSPGNKCTYTANITVPAPLVALMSALQEGESADDDSKTITYRFKQPVPMPAYLVAIAIGALEKRDIGPRTAVWSEKELVEAGAYEFADTEKYLQVGEAICGPYVWGRYDILLLPPSFPYGGMENPCLTFVTPTLLAGDRSLANVVAHEAAHSWAGNLVSPTNWEGFWINEGFTVFIERKMLRALFGEQFMHMHAIIGWNALQDSVDRFGADHPFTNLVVNVDGVDPDDSFSSVPYEKGFNFLFYLESLVGGHEVMCKFLRHHFDTYKFGNVDSYGWKAFFLDYFKDKVDAEKLDSIDWDTWFHSPGMPPKPDFDTTLVDAANKYAAKVMAGNAEPTTDDIKGWSSTQMVVFLEKMQEIQSEQLSKAEDGKVDEINATQAGIFAKLDEALKISVTRNTEIRFRWLTLCVKAEMESVFPQAVALATEQGRMKFTRPMYRTLFNTVKGKQLAIDTFQKHRANYHNICSKMVAKDLGL